MSTAGKLNIKQKLPHFDPKSHIFGGFSGDVSINVLLNSENVSVAHSGLENQCLVANETLECDQNKKLKGEFITFESSLTNILESALTGISALEPLSITFEPGENEGWTFHYLNGGTTEWFYPPYAFQPHNEVLLPPSYSDVAGPSATTPYIPTLNPDGVRIESGTGGRSSSEFIPMWALMNKIGNQRYGVFLAMEWSGCWYLNSSWGPKNRLNLEAGVKVYDMSLESGETITMPKVHLGFFNTNTEDMFNLIRSYINEHICKSAQKGPSLPPISYSHWDGIWNGLNFDLMCEQADRMAELGGEIFSVDAGWFEKGFQEGIGNWDLVDTEKFPNGLEPLAGYIKSLGMGMGMWFEPERVVAGTTLAQSHPEWLIPCPDTKTNGYYLLNLSLTEVQDYLIEMLSSWISRLDLRWTRWDFNIDPVPYFQSVDPSLKIQFDYYQGLYRVMDTLAARHPDWLLESCASGGLRIDLGLARHVDTFSISDQMTNHKICAYMQARGNQFLPGSLLNGGMAVVTGNRDYGISEDDILSRMMGGLSFEGDISGWSEELTSAFARWIQIFKSIRHLLNQNVFYPLPIPQNTNNWDAIQFSSYDSSHIVVFVFPGRESEDKNLILKQLVDNSDYKLVDHSNRNSRVISSKVLTKEGFTVVAKGRTGLLYEFKKCG